MSEYVMIPRSLVSNTGLGDKRVIAYSSIVLSNWNGNRIEDLVSYSHFSTCRDKTGALNQYRHVVDGLIANGYFSHTNRGIVYTVQEDGFGIIYNREFQAIISERDRRKMIGQRMNHAHILLLLAHIRASMIRHPGKPDRYSDLLTRISENTGLSVRSVSSGIEILEQLNIIRARILPRYQGKDGRWHSNVHVFENAASYYQPLSPHG